MEPKTKHVYSTVDKSWIVCLAKAKFKQKMEIVANREAETVISFLL